MPSLPAPEKLTALANHNWALMRQLVDLLRESTVGLTPATLLELLEERALVPSGNLSRRGVYQRVLRALQQLEAMGCVAKAGKRFVLDEEALHAELQRQAKAAIQRVFEIPFLTADSQEVQAALLGAIQETVQVPQEAPKRDLNANLDD